MALRQHLPRTMSEIHALTKNAHCVTKCSIFF